ncbi:hypothetical protein D3H65_11100 [Paraflavitalea soli]|uniref:Uncharacterized protein n=1 Tax=Paraflavitalea soli TaxID=2315862 RepID=A0A3B7MVP8_9BACT|nr:hypothetical protein [Paraflavitalea soli]AXY74491.1 hypothetical protein D3H65_11100 [Paraflavitalea soli]
MRRIILLCCLLFTASLAFSQKYIGLSKKAVYRNLKTAGLANSPIETNDQSVVMHVKDSAYQPASFYYYFDKDGKCYQEKSVTFCDTCYIKYRNRLLDRKKYEWVKVNDTVYVSKFSRKRTLELHPNQHDRTINLFKTPWQKEEYEQLLARRQ